MNEALRNLLIMVWAVSAVHYEAPAQVNNYTIEEEAHDESQPTLIMGSVTNSSVGTNEVAVEHNPDAPNPLGITIIVINNSASSPKNLLPKKDRQSTVVL